MKKVLFVCIHNSARSQMAEAFLNKLGAGDFKAESAGLEPGKLNPLAVQAMSEVGYDISENESNSVFEFFKEGRKYHFVIKVCDQINGQRCPIFPGVLNVESWNLKDPANLEEVREVRDQIKVHVERFIAENKNK